jgi:UDP-N-acetylglucosamine--N-acetylmuramyl-(pentapeptide) pyrophosphoryl-undecaprenol N-acetylglucosamine transferase
MENRLVPPAGIALDRFAFNGMRGKGLVGNVRGALRSARRFRTARGLMSRRRPDAVLGMGGYVCFPGGWMAWLHRKPLLLVNADATLLLSNRALRWAARRIAFGFAGRSAQDLGSKAIVTGNPVREQIEALPEPGVRFAGRAGALRLLVVGGSLGARVLNECVPQAIALMTSAQRPRVTHQTGEASHQAVRAAYAAAGADAEVLPFIDDMANRLGECDVIVCRAGAITVSELCAAGVAAVLVPFVASTTSHQRDNAAWMAARERRDPPAAGRAVARPPRRSAERPDARRAARDGDEGARARRPHAAARVADEIEAMVAA